MCLPHGTPTPGASSIVMKRGDLVRGMRFDFDFDDRVGIILTWVRTGGPEGTVWEVFYEDGSTEYWDENDLEVVSESR
tara:strand:+ start:413 stop:646 length:234 start_codon:yes stop_codon:yes gene_type:complete